MPKQTCANCDYFTPDATDVTVGWCWWASRHPVPSCYSQAEAETWAGAGEVCPCWQPQGHIDAFLAAARARRAQETP